MAFYSPEGDLINKVFLTEEEILDNLVGDTLWIWGDNYYGETGTNTSGSSTNKSAPVQTISGGNNWKYVSAGYQLGGIKTDGTLWIWGRNHNGQLGDNTTVNKSSPVQTIASTTTWEKVALGYSISSGIKTDGTLWTWGKNQLGQLGDNTTINRSSPVQTIATGSNWREISAGSSYFIAIKTDGTLWSWGDSQYGQLGINIFGNSRSSPVQIGLSNEWKRINAGDNFSTAIKNDGTLWVWGYNNRGQLGDNTTLDRSSPVQTVAGGTWKQSAAGANSMSGIKKDGTLWSWGRNFNGTLGDNTTIDRSSPVQVISGGSNWLKIEVGRQSTYGIKTDGTLWVWGTNGYGNLGINSFPSYRSSPVQTTLGGNNWKQVSALRTVIALTNSQIT
jgi:alpha-tubulin suppressor-like RCC1 family protein